MEKRNNIYDVIIIGGGPAGLSAALVLGRCRRKILVYDDEKYRNKSALSMNGYLTRDGINPVDFLKTGRKELSAYGVEIKTYTIKKVHNFTGYFEVISDNENNYAKKILIATGLKDKIPEIKEIDKFYGRSVFHCPYCDGWEFRDKKIAVYAKGKEAYVMAYSLKTWSDNIIICTDGKTKISSKKREKLISDGINIYPFKIKELDGENGKLEKIIFKNDESIECDAMFFNTGENQQSNLAEQLGLEFSRKRFIKCSSKQQTSLKGVFVAGDAAKDMKFVIVAAAEGAKAAVAINTELQEEERKEV